MTLRGLVAIALLAAPAGAQLAFLNWSSASDLDVVFTKGNTHTLGCAWVDYNGDFWPDLFITNGGGLDHLLYRNDGDGTFTNVSFLVAKPDVGSESAGVLFGDLENDGDSDVVVIDDNPSLNLFAVNPPEGGANLLYRNEGDGTFTEVGAAAGIQDPDGLRNIAGALADFDRDGFLDLYVAAWRPQSPLGMAQFDRMLRNDGDGTFSIVTDVAHTDGYGRDALVVLAADVDKDLWPDLYVGTISPEGGNEPDYFDILYLNEHEGTRFCDRTGNPNVFGDDSTASMGVDVGDIDNDGDWDLYVTDVAFAAQAPYGNALYEGTPDDGFRDNTADVAGIDVQKLSWPADFADFDNDGWVDLWVGLGDDPEPTRVYVNDGDGTFTLLAVGGPGTGRSRGGSIADYDGDGDVDIFEVRHNQNSVLWRNFGQNLGNWLELKLIGAQSNRDAIGARVEVTAGGETMMRRVSGGDSAHSQMDLIVHVGVGAAETADVEISWPSGVVQALPAVPTNQLVFVDEETGLLAETLAGVDARWDPSTERLQVWAESSFGGRTVLSVEHFGPLLYDAGDVVHRGSFDEVAEDPETITLRSDRGYRWVVRVDAP